MIQLGGRSSSGEADTPIAANSVLANPTASPALAQALALELNSVLGRRNGNIQNFTFGINIEVDESGAINVNSTTIEDVLALGVVLQNVQGQLTNAEGVALDGTYTINTYTDLAGIDPALNADLNIVARNLGNNTSGYHRIPLCATGVLWEILGGEALFMSGAPALKFVAPESTFTSTYTLTQSGANTQIQGGGAHGLTTAIAVGSSINVSAGTGTGVVGLHKIVSIAVDTSGNTIVVDIPWNGSNTITGISLKNTRVRLQTINLPPLNANSAVRFDITQRHPSTSTTSKEIFVFLDTWEISSPDISGSDQTGNRFSGGFSNMSSTSVQEAWFAQSSNNGVGTSTGAWPTAGAIQTNVTRSMYIEVTPASANDPIELLRFSFWLKL